VWTTTRGILRQVVFLWEGGLRHFPVRTQAFRPTLFAWCSYLASEAFGSKIHFSRQLLMAGNPVAVDRL
jgi:hypothetical protein